MTYRPKLNRASARTVITNCQGSTLSIYWYQNAAHNVPQARRYLFTGIKCGSGICPTVTYQVVTRRLDATYLLVSNCLAA